MLIQRTRSDAYQNLACYPAIYVGENLKRVVPSNVFQLLGRILQYYSVPSPVLRGQFFRPRDLLPPPGSVATAGLSCHCWA